MIEIKVHDAAGATEGRPTYPFDIWGYTYSDGFIGQDAKVRGGVFKGHFADIRAEGSFDIYYPWSTSTVTSFAISVGRRYGHADTPLYIEEYDRPFTIGGEPSIEKVLAKADRLAEKGIDFVGNGFGNAFAGKAGNDSLAGLGGRDRLDGGAGRDRLDGGGGADRLDGGLGRDRLTGGDGADTFVYRSERGAGVPDRPDVITDLDPSEDRIDLRPIDADIETAPDNAFRFIGVDPFSGRARELRYTDGLLSGDTNGDGRADFAISIANDPSLTPANLLL
jgi:Ca2+-binding RTX toxin-like protein